MDDVVIRTEELTKRYPGNILAVDRLDLEVHAGEIVGIAGLMGSGRSRLLHTILGAQPRTGGSVTFDGRDFRPRHPADAVAAGIGMVPGERSGGLVMDLSIRDNIALPSLERRLSDDLVRQLMEQLDIRPRDPDQKIRELSGGNQQKVIFAKWLAAQVEILILDEPTQGVDIGAKRHIHRLMRDFAERGGAIVFASSETHEVMSLSDKVAAVRQGEVVAQMVRGSEYTERALRATLGG